MQKLEENMEQMRERNLGFERKSERQLLKLCDNMQTDSERLNQEHLTRITRLCWVVWPRGKLSKCTTQPSPNSQSSVSDTTQPSLNKSLTSFLLFLLLLFSLLPTNEIDAWKIWICDWSKWRWFEFRMCVGGEGVLLTADRSAAGQLFTIQCEALGQF